VLCDIFQPGDVIRVIGTSKGKGFQGVIKRHHFRGGAASHGSMFHRAPGSIGPSAYPSRVSRTRMAGRMGGDKTTLKHVKVVKVDVERNLVFLKGAVPAVAMRFCGCRRRERGRSMKMDVRNWDNEVVGSFELPPDVFTYPARPHLVYEVVKAYLAGLRRGTHATKNRALVSGGGKKPWKQKGTGRSRHGSSRSPLWRHGGTVFGPQPRSYSMKVNVQAKKNALRSVLSEKIANGTLLVLESLEIDSNRTKDFIARLGKLGLGGEKVLFVDSFENLNLMLATRNRPELETADSLHVHVYQSLHRQACRVLAAGAAAASGGVVIMKDPREIILRPIVTEKTADAKESSNTVCFQVARHANKIEVRQAVEKLFGVKVEEVRS